MAKLEVCFEDMYTSHVAVTEVWQLATWLVVTASVMRTCVGETKVPKVIIWHLDHLHWC